MKLNLHNTLNRLAATTLIVGTGIISLAFVVNEPAKKNPPQGYTMISKQTFVTVEGQVSVQAMKFRYQRSDGAWKLVTIYYDANGNPVKQDVGFGQLGRGVFQVDEKNRALRYLSPMAAEAPQISGKDLKQDSRFTREEIVLGFKTYVLHQPLRDGSGYIETYVCPELQGSIKRVDVSKAGTVIIEPTSINLGEPDAKVFDSIPDYPINFEMFEKKIKGLEEEGNIEAANQLKQLLQQMRPGKKE